VNEFEKYLYEKWTKNDSVQISLIPSSNPRVSVENVMLDSVPRTYKRSP